MGFHREGFRFEGSGGRSKIGLKRTGKSCRLRWVNYLHPGLKRCKMSPHEERLVLELHSKWGNRWSRIARKLPGRTDNEIKNYWRTHMRKKAQERKKGGGAAAVSPSSSSSSFSSNSSSSSRSSGSSNCSSSVSNGNSPAAMESGPVTEKKDRSFYDTGGLAVVAAAATAASASATTRGGNKGEEEAAKPSPPPPPSSMVDEIWKDMDFFGDEPIKPVYDDYCYGGGGAEAVQSMASPIWDYFPVSLWNMDDEEDQMISKKLPAPPPITDQFNSFYNPNNNQDMMSTAFLTGFPA